MAKKPDYFYDGFDKLQEKPAGDGGASIVAKDENAVVIAGMDAINFIGANVLAKPNALNPTQLDVFIPPPTYASHFNTSDGSNNSIVPSVATTMRNTANPVGGIYDIGSWTAGAQHPTVNSNITYTTPDFFSCVDSSTGLTATLFATDGTTILSTFTTLIDSIKTVGTNIVMAISGFQSDADRKKCIVSVTFNLNLIISNGGRFSISIVHNDKTDGTYTKIQSNIFYDPNLISPALSGVSISQNVPVYKAVSGIRGYSIGSSFTVSISNIDNLNNSSYPNTQVHLDGSSFGMTAIDLLGTDLTNWNYNYNLMGASYFKSNWTISASNFCSVNPTARVWAYWIDWTNGANVYSSVFPLIVDTYTDSSTRIFDDFNTESQRLISTGAAWDSTQSLITYDGGTGLQQRCGLLIYPTVNYSTYNPVGFNYSTTSGDKNYIRKFYHPTNNFSNGVFTFSNHNYAETDITHGDLQFYISPDFTNWYNLSQLYVGGALNPNDPCRVESDVYYMDNSRIKFTFGTGGFSTQVWLKVVYKGSATGMSKFLDGISLNWI